jgi:hypothetical protein
MKTKHATTKTDTRKPRRLFGLSPDELKLVVGGTGVVMNGQQK